MLAPNKCATPATGGHVNPPGSPQGNNFGRVKKPCLQVLDNLVLVASLIEVSLGASLKEIEILRQEKSVVQTDLSDGVFRIENRRI